MAPREGERHSPDPDEEVGAAPATAYAAEPGRAARPTCPRQVGRQRPGFGDVPAAPQLRQGEEDSAEGAQTTATTPPRRGHDGAGFGGCGWRARRACLVAQSDGMTPAASPGNGRPFLRTTSGEDELSVWRFRRAHRALYRGVYVSAETPVTHRLLAEAALLLAEPGSYLSHHTAAQLWGGTVPDHADVHVTYPRMRAQCFGIAAHRPKARQHVVRWMGLPVTGPAQTFLDLATSSRSSISWCSETPWCGEALHARRAGRPRREAPRPVLAARPASGAGWCVPASTRRWRPGFGCSSSSPGCPSPRSTTGSTTTDGNLLRRYDLSYLAYRLIIEYDGRQHAESEEQWPTTSAGTSSSTTS